MSAFSRRLTGLVVAALVGSGCGSTGPSNGTPRGGTVQSSVSAGLAGWTEVTFTAQNVVDPDGDAITYIWDFGDGTTQSVTAPTVVKRFDAPGVRNVTLQVRDNSHPPTDAGQISVTVRSLTGAWRGTLTRPPIPVTAYSVDAMVFLTQSGQSVSGRCDPDPLSGWNFLDLRIESQPSESVVRMSGHCPNALVLFEFEYFPGLDQMSLRMFGDGTAGTVFRQ